MRCDVCEKEMPSLNYNVKMLEDGIGIVCKDCLTHEVEEQERDYMAAAKDKSIRSSMTNNYNFGGPVYDCRGRER